VGVIRIIFWVLNTLFRDFS